MGSIDLFQRSARIYLFGVDRIKQLNTSISQICYNNAFSHIDAYFQVKEKEILLENRKFVDFCINRAVEDKEMSREILSLVYIEKYRKGTSLSTNSQIAEKLGMSRMTLYKYLTEFESFLEDLIPEKHNTEKYIDRDNYIAMKELLSDISNMSHSFRDDNEKLTEYKIKASNLKSPNLKESTFNPTPPPIYYNERLYRNIDKYTELVRLQGDILDVTTRVIYQLPLSVQPIVMMYYFNGKTYKEISNMLSYKSDKDLINRVNSDIKDISTDDNIKLLNLVVSRYRKEKYKKS